MTGIWLRRDTGDSGSDRHGMQALTGRHPLFRFAGGLVWRRVRKVDFLVAGVQKGGTTALDLYLREHPQICMAGRKEVHFFDNERIQKLPFLKEAVYRSCFSHCGKGQVLGEATPIYSFWDNAPRRIWKYNPGIKLILVLRNPIERAYSHWNMERSRGNEWLPFSEAIRHEQERCRSALPFQHRIFSYVSRGFYAEQLRRLYRFFPPSQVLAVRNEILRADPQSAMKEIFRFLGVSEMEGTIEAREVHSMPYEDAMDSGDRAYLERIYFNDIRELERILEWDCSDWLGE